MTVPPVNLPHLTNEKKKKEVFIPETHRHVGGTFSGQPTNV